MAAERDLRFAAASATPHPPNGAVARGVGLFTLAVFLLALAPRWIARDTYVTADEDNWMRRAGGFAWGLANGRPGRTFQSGHPGVLTMELAILGQGPGGAERFADPVTGDPRVLTAVPEFFTGLVEARRAFALSSAALVALNALLTWRLFGLGPALVAGLLLALDPFLLAHSQLVHLDATLAGLCVASALCALVRWSAGGGRRWVLAGGALSGLALLAKMPAVYLGLFVPLLAVALGRRRGARALLTELIAWALTALAVCVALWPSVWVSPLTTVTRLVDFTRQTGGQPHEQGSFWLGQPVVDPGPLFYPLALVLRLSPVTALGLVCLALAAWRLPLTRSPRLGRTALGLLAFVAGFTLFMTLGAKKFDRYLLPVFPALDILAGLGLWLSWNALALRRSLAAATVTVLAAWPAVSVFPHYLAYYNPLLGGAPAAARLIPVGEGEGLREAAEWLNLQPDAIDLAVVADSFDALKANFVGGGEPLRDRVSPSTDFVVLYVYQDQIGHSPQVTAAYADQAPALVVQLNGLDYVRVYNGPRGGRS
jgi:Dolichyl-phosphate-mannose-protein mannosyltransferase